MAYLMSYIAPLEDSARRAPAESVGSRTPVTVRSQLAQLEKQLSEWIHCASAKTQAGRDKIAEISSKIDAIKGAMQEAVKRAQGADAGTAEVAEAEPPSVRLDGTGAWISVQA